MMLKADTLTKDEPYFWFLNVLTIKTTEKHSYTINSIQKKEQFRNRTLWD